MSYTTEKDGDQLHNILQARTWFGFDLDDTLHEFRKASREATTSVLTCIASENPSTTLRDLQAQYGIILKQGTADEFTDGKTSYDYRRARFVATLSHFGLRHDRVDELLEDYERVLVDNLTLKPGAVSLLEAIKASGRKIAVITEGPQDAQQRAVRDLGIEEYMDFLATTNFFGVAKIDGLFGKVLDHLKITPQDIVYIGDSQERDIEPANKEGILAIHLHEAQTAPLVLQPPSINSLEVLAKLI
ncbi:hydrolase-the HAD superfamily [Fusarium subglutinans]|uniref:Hydrolase-the HAD superfamily n=1 Tax=Gibberella subglutinans TaxID=42677 RepID=A0A8H5QAQ1_GIBSU|nr:hydrolase-the HAD superfamily [Fusarium subglutinans]KAF5611173.1 hydrolase-the HAD superfamily [Fusarium subglutinans]